MKSFRDNRSGAPRGPKKSFGGGGGGFSRGGSSSAMHPATCTSCGAACEVPFKPTGMRPVLCSACFNKDGASTPSWDSSEQRTPKRNFEEKRSFNKPTRDFRNSDMPQPDNSKRQLEIIEAKLDQILRLLSDD